MQKINNTSSLFRSEMIKEGVKIKLIHSYGNKNSSTNGAECTILRVGCCDYGTSWILQDHKNNREIQEYFEGTYKCEAIIYTETGWKDIIPSLEAKVISLEEEIKAQQIRINKIDEEIKMHTDFDSEEEYLASKLLEVMTGSKAIKVIAEVLKTMKNTNLL